MYMVNMYLFIHITLFIIIYDINNVHIRKGSILIIICYYKYMDGIYIVLYIINVLWQSSILNINKG